MKKMIKINTKTNTKRWLKNIELKLTKIIFQNQIGRKREVLKNDFHVFFLYFIVVDVRLSSSSLPNEGFVQIVTKDNGIKSVCGDSLKNQAKDVVCDQLGYNSTQSYTKKVPPSSDTNVEMISGWINCDGTESDLSKCSIITNTTSCSELSYINCKFLDK